MDRARSYSFFIDGSEYLLYGNLKVRLYREDINSLLFAVRIGSIIKVVLKNRFKLFISTFLKLYRYEQYLYFRVRIILGSKTKHGL
jgi:hypothetical protein